jgi:hypothetical protein
MLLLSYPLDKKENELRRSGIYLVAGAVGVSDKTYNAVGGCHTLSDMLVISRYVLLTQGNVVKCKYVTAYLSGNRVGGQLSCDKTQLFYHIKQRSACRGGDLASVYYKLHYFSSSFSFSSI